MPKPPTCIKIIRIVCPNKVKCVPVSTTINPVTQTALVEVNKASRYEISSWVALGKINKSEPIKIITKKLAIKI